MRGRGRYEAASCLCASFVWLGRQARALQRVASKKPLCIAKSSQDTALRDIDYLMQRGVLAKDAVGGRSTSYSLVLPTGGDGM